MVINEKALVRQMKEAYKTDGTPWRWSGSG